jgi:AraC family transcriptional regulator
MNAPPRAHVAVREVQDFVLREARFGSGYGGTVHRHATPYVAFILDGGFTETCRTGRARYGAGSLHLHPSDDPHAGIVDDGGAHCFNIMATGRLGRRLDGAAGDLRHRELPAHLSSIARRCHRGFLARDGASDLECESAAIELIAAVLRLQMPRESTAPRWVHVARDYLHAHVGEPVSLTDLAGAAGVHRVHLARVFRRRFGVTPAEYARQLRLESACRALVESDRPIAAVALDAGYSSQAHFTRAFRAQYGATPGSYRRSRR